MKRFFNLLLVVLLTLLATMFLVGVLSSCATRKVTTSHTKVDSVSRWEYDSIRRSHENEKIEWMYQLRDALQSSVIFDTLYVPGDTIVNTVTIREDGSTEFRGRIKSAFLSKDRAVQESIKKQRIIDSLINVKQKKEIQVVTDTVTKEKKVSFIPWWAYVLFFASVAFHFRKYIKL